MLWGSGPNDGDWMPPEPGTGPGVRVCNGLITWVDSLDTSKMGKTLKDFVVWHDSQFVCYRFDRLRAKDVNGWLQRDLTRSGAPRGGRIPMDRIRSASRDGAMLTISVETNPDDRSVRFMFRDEANAQQFEHELRRQLGGPT